MKKLISTIIIVCIMTSSFYRNAFAEETLPKGEANAINQELITNNPVYKVIVPTDYSFTVDPYEIVDEGSMIGSPDFYIINKSNVPIQLDLSLKIGAREGIELDVKSTKAEVNHEGDLKQIWFAAAVPLSVDTTRTENIPLQNADGKQVYSYGDNYSIHAILSSEIEVAEDKESTSEAVKVRTLKESTVDKEEIQTENIIAQTEKKLTQVDVKSASGSAILYTNPTSATGSAIQLMQVVTVSGGAIDYTNPISVTGSAIQVADITTVTGSAIQVADITTVSGSAIEYTDPTSVTGSAIQVADITTVSGGAIEYTSPTSVTGNAIKVAEVKVTEATEVSENTMEDKEPKEVVIKKGIPVLYNDTTAVKGYYGILADLSDTSNNVVTIDTSLNASMSFTLTQATEYLLDDGSIVTGEVAENNGGVAVFRFIGAVNTNANWANSDVKVTVQYNITDLSKADTEQPTSDVNNEKEDKDTLVGNVKSGINITEHKYDQPTVKIDTEETILIGSANRINNDFKPRCLISNSGMT